MRGQRVELGLEVLDVALLALAERSLPGGRVSLRFVRGCSEGSGEAYAALFCALRRLWAGVIDSFSSLLLRWPLASMAS